jgi:cytochrome P450
MTMAASTSSASLIDPEALPGPSGYPVVGIAPKLDREGFHLQLENWYREFGGRFTFKLGPKRFVVFADAPACKDVLRRRPDEFRRGTHMTDIIKELGARGVFAAEGDLWRKQRKLIMPGFNAAQLRRFLPQIQTVVERLHGQWTRAAASGGDWNFRDTFERFTTDVTMSVAFGYDANTVEGGRDILQADIQQVLPEVQRRLNAAFPLWRYYKTARHRRVDEAIGRVFETLRPIVAAMREKVAADPEGPSVERADTLLEAMLAAEHLDEERERFTEDEIFGNVLTLLLAGEDTTAHTLSWIVHALVSEDGVQDRLREELDRELGDAPGISSIDDTKRLPYLNGVIQESLRLRSVAPLMFYQAETSTEIDGVRINPEHVVLILTRHATNQPEHFSEVNRFLPERWNRADEAAVQRCPAHDHRSMMPFGHGPRTCPGRGLSILEMNVAISRLVRNFVIEPTSDPAQVREVFAFTMHPQGFTARLRAR